MSAAEKRRKKKQAKRGDVRFPPTISSLHVRVCACVRVCVRVCVDFAKR
jgi:hypothetical protein